MFSRRHKKNKKHKKINTRKKILKKLKGGDFSSDVTNVVDNQLRTRESNLAKMLSVACKNPDNCIAIGVYGDIIKRYFNDFHLSSYVDVRDIRRMGKPSANGFIMEIPFEKNGFKAYTVLKCSAANEADNLFYEYYVGKFFINKYVNKFPCFLETYHCYRIRQHRYWERMKNDYVPKFYNTNELVTGLENIDINEGDLNVFADSCRDSKYLAVLIQHFDNFRSLDDLYKEFQNIQYEVLNILYQVYYPLVQLGDKYTHYDLHTNNIFLYKPYNEKEYILMKYHRNGKIIQFPSEYIVKIIDYGRNYFKTDSISTDKIIKDYICTSPLCQPDCGDENGYSAIRGDIPTPQAYYYDIKPNKPNMSHDLRAANELKGYLNQIISPDQSSMYNAFIYQTYYGTVESRNPNFADNKIIKDIYNMVDSIELVIDHFNKNKIERKYDSSWKCVAELNVYDDGRDYDFKIL